MYSLITIILRLTSQRQIIFQWFYCNIYVNTDILIYFLVLQY